jgi:hypothetical protein
MVAVVFKLKHLLVAYLCGMGLYAPPSPFTYFEFADHEYGVHP